jgi:hypothetical protein
MATILDRVIITLDASIFLKRVGDKVKEGETLGCLDNRPVKSPCDGYIGCVTFNPYDHTLAVYLVYNRQPNVPKWDVLDQIISNARTSLGTA